MRFVMEALDRCVLDCPVHALDLAVGPRMVGFCQPALDAVTGASAVERMASEPCCWSVTVLRKISELNAVVGEHSVDAVGDGLDQGFEEGGGCRHVRLHLQPHEGEFARSIDRHLKAQLAFRCADFSEINVEEADRIALEARLGRLVVFDIREPRDPMALQTAMQ